MITLGRQFKGNKQGMSIIEIIVAVAIFAVVGTSVSLIIIYAFNDVRYASELSEATFLVNEGIDAARSIRDSNWEDLTDGDHGLTTTSGYWEFSGASDTSGDYTRVVTVEEVERDGNFDIVTSGGTVDPRSKKVTVTVSWDLTPGDTKQMTAAAYLVDWPVMDWLETTDSDFGAGTHTDTEVNDTGTAAYVALAAGSGSGSGQFLDDTQAEFDTGTYSDTQWNTDHVELTSTGISNGTGTYTSEVFDAATTATWEELSWLPAAPYGKELPDSASTETDYSSGNFDMSDNIMLFHLNEASGTINDTSGYSNDGSAASGTVYGVTGMFGDALDLSGASDGVDVANSTSIDALDHMTISMWAKTDDYTQQNQVLFSYYYSNSDRAYVMLDDQSNGIRVYNDINNSNDWEAETSWTPANDEWFHIAWVIDGTDWKVYVNGVEEGTSTESLTIADISNGLTVTAGARAGQNDREWEGDIDEVALFNTDLSPSQISDLYNRGAQRLKFQIRSCDDDACSGESFAGPDGTGSDYYEEIDNSTITLPEFTITNQADNQYIQYQATFETDTTTSPELEEVQISYTLEATGPFEQDSGANNIVSMEAENYHRNTSQGGHSWNLLTTQGGYSGDGYMRAEPDDGTANNTGYETNSPHLEFDVDFVTTGTHYVWLRGYATGGNDDSAHAGLDGVGVSTADRISSFSTGTWDWSKATMDGVDATIDVLTTGEHVVDIWMREDGFRVDKIVLTTSSSYTPSGTGPTESEKTFEGIPTQLTIVDDSQVEFDAGTYSSTEWSTDHVGLTSGSATGTYTSQIFDSTDVETTWDTIAWSEDLTGNETLRLEVGSATTDHEFTTVNLQNTYDNPVVIPFYYESANTEVISPRLDNITSTSFDVALTSPAISGPTTLTDDTDTDFAAGTFSSAEVSGTGTAAEVVLTSSMSLAEDANSGVLSTNSLNDVHGLAQDDVWAVGDDYSGSAIILHFDGSDWSQVSAPIGSDLNAVHFLASNDGWAVGDSGYILHYNGTSWSIDTDTGNERWYSVFAISSSDVWAVGRNGDMAHYNGSSWSESSVGGNDFNSVFAIDSSNVWAVGENGTIQYYNGSSWSSQSSGTSNDLRGVYMLTASGGLAVGDSGTIRVFNGSTWSSMTSGTSTDINSVDILGGTSAVAVGDNGLILYYSGSWSSVSSPVSDNLYGIHANSIDDIWMVGANGTIVGYQSTYATPGIYYSAVIDSGQSGTSWDTISWVEDLPSGTDIVMYTRSGDTATPDGTWSSFAGAHTDPTGESIVSGNARYLQYGAYLTTTITSNTPALDSVTIEYTPGGGTLSTDTIHYLVIEEGAWTLPDGTQIEAHTLDTSTTAYKSNWSGVSQTYTNTYSSAPVVLHQVQTYNDENWIETYVSSSSSRSNPPDASGFVIAMNGAEAVTSHSSETLGWVAIEQGTGTLDSVDFEAYQTADFVRGETNGDGCFEQSYVSSFASAPITLADQEEMDGNDGSWGIGCSNSTSQVGLRAQEDQETDSEMGHVNETFAYVAFASAFDYVGASKDITFQVRSCDDAACSGETFVGPDGTSGTVFTTPGGEALDVADNQYFQYQGTFTSDAALNSPELFSVTIEYTQVISSGTYPASGTFESQIFNSDSTSTNWLTLFWSKTTPVDTNATVAIRSGNTSTPDGSWSAWSSEYSLTTGVDISAQTGQYLQYRVTLTTSDTEETPRFEDITITYK